MGNLLSLASAGTREKFARVIYFNNSLETSQHEESHRAVMPTSYMRGETQITRKLRLAEQGMVQDSDVLVQKRTGKQIQPWGRKELCLWCPCSTQVVGNLTDNISWNHPYDLIPRVSMNINEENEAICLKTTMISFTTYRKDFYYGVCGFSELVSPFPPFLAIRNAY